MRVEVLGGVERRRRWSRDDKMRIIEETLAPGAVVTEIARRPGIATSRNLAMQHDGASKSTVNCETSGSSSPAGSPIAARIRP
jgi:transposase-like protein